MSKSMALTPRHQTQGMYDTEDPLMYSKREREERERERGGGETIDTVHVASRLDASCDHMLHYM